MNQISKPKTVKDEIVEQKEQMSLLLKILLKNKSRKSLKKENTKALMILEQLCREKIEGLKRNQKLKKNKIKKVSSKKISNAMK